MELNNRDYYIDLSKFNPNHRYGFMYNVRCHDLQVDEMRSAETYEHIASQFELAIEELKQLPKKKPVKRCPCCGTVVKRSRLIHVWYWVMKDLDCLFEKNCYVLTIDRAIERLESALQRVRQLAADERRRCKECGALKRRRAKKVRTVKAKA